MRLVLGHESAHLRQRHHLAAQFSVALAHAFGRVWLFRRAAQQVPRLLEMAADDGAVRVERATKVAGDRAAVRRRLAHALVTLAGAQAAPAGALGAGGSAVARVRRLSGPRVRPRPPEIVLLVAGAGLALAGCFCCHSARRVRGGHAGLRGRAGLIRQSRHLLSAIVDAVQEVLPRGPAMARRSSL
ncbi:hypothetical protein [Promicromonospora soli]